MAKNDTVWGIDIGNSSLKALRCRSGASPGTMEAIGFDFIEHSKIMSQPGADPAEILAETLKTFLSRNNISGNKIAISVSGQNTISRFLKLPPVDEKKIPDIIKFEAKQWFPFDLQDVIWDYQIIGDVEVEGGIVLDAEAGMFAMKREVALKTIGPYTKAGIDIDCIQSSPLSLYNYAVFDKIPTRGQDDGNPETVVMLCIGTDATDVVVTNGTSIWIRSVPIGGNQFTKALTKGLKLTFAKAEFVKRNPSKAEDPKAVFQAMRPVFNDLLSEIHRSMEYYSSLNKKAKFARVYALGNTIKMPGLRQFLTQNLGYEVMRPTAFNRLTGESVTEAAAFKDNMPSFSVCYGLAAQLLGMGALSTNLVPKDIVMDRIIRNKKPWALAAAAAVLLGLTVQFSRASLTLEGIKIGDYGAAKSQTESVASKSSGLKSATSAAVSDFQAADTIGVNLTSNVEGRVTWLELLRALNVVIPQYRSSEDEQIRQSLTDLLDDNKLRQEVIHKQNRLFITNITAQEVSDPATWWGVMKDKVWYNIDDIEMAEMKKAESGAEAGGTAAPAASAASSTPGESPERALLEKVAPPPIGPCKIVQIVGYHYHNSKDEKQTYGPEFVRKTLIHNLKHGTIELPASMAKQLTSPDLQLKETVSMKDLGIYNPTLLLPRLPTDTQVLDPNIILQKQNEFRRMMLEKGNTSGGMGGSMGASGGEYGGGGYGGGGGSTFGLDMNAMSFGLTSSGQAPAARDSGGRGGRRRPRMTEGDMLTTLASQMKPEEVLALKRFDFTVQFVWCETPPNIREEKRKEAEAAAAAAAPAEQALAPIEETAIEIE